MIISNLFNLSILICSLCMQPVSFPPLPPLRTIYEKDHPKFQKKSKVKAKAKPVDVRVEIAIRVTSTPFSSPEQASESSRLLPLVGEALEHSNESNSSCNRRAVTCCVGITACLLVFYIVKGIVSLLACSPAQTSDVC
jgi:hypothetical protein